MVDIGREVQAIFQEKFSDTIAAKLMESDIIKLYPNYTKLSPTEQKWLELYLRNGGDPLLWDAPVDYDDRPKVNFNSSEFWEEKRKLFGFGELFVDKKFDDISRKHPGHVESLKKYCMEIDRYISGDNKGVGIILIGPVGTMKTTMLWILAKAIVFRYSGLKCPHPFIRYVRFYDACNRLSHERFSGYGGPGYAEHLSNVDVLMIDDIAPFGIRPHEQEEFFEIVDRRWMSKKILFAATNQSDEWLYENLPQVRDRWNTSLVYHFDGESTRKPFDGVLKRLGLK